MNIRYPSVLGIIDASGNLATLTGGSLNVNITGGSFSLGTADKSAFTYGVSTEQPVGGVFQDTAPTLTSGTTGVLRLTSFRGLHTNLRTAAGVELLGQQVSASSIPVVIASDQSTFPVTANAGTNLNTSLLALDTSVNGILVSQGSTTSGEKGPLVQGAVTTGSPTYTTAQTSPLSLTTAGALRVDGSAVTQPVSGTVTTTSSGYISANTPTDNEYTSTNITTAAYVQLVASLTTTTQEVEIFDSSGQYLFLATGAPGVEVNQVIIFPGGNGRIRLKILAGTRISAKAISATANSGALLINYYG